MNLKDIDITEERFFKIGFWCFIIIGCANFVNLFIMPSVNIFNFLARAGGIFFNFVVAFFFQYLLKSFKGTVDQVGDPTELLKAVEEFK